MTNIVVVQFVSDIQTSMDVKYNLTCTTRGPGSAVVTSGLIGSGYSQQKYFNHNHENIWGPHLVYFLISLFEQPILTHV